MDNKYQGYLLAAGLGALGGGLAAIMLTRAIPKMMAGMMQKMILRMKESGCSPAEI